MPQRPSKKSSSISFRKDRVEDYVSNVDKDLKSLFDYVNTFPRVYTQSAEPTLSNDTWGFWKDSDDSKFYLILNIAGDQKKVELT